MRWKKKGVGSKNEKRPGGAAGVRMGCRRGQGNRGHHGWGAGVQLRHLGWMTERTEPAQGSADLRAETGAKSRDVSGCEQQGSHSHLPIIQDTDYLSVPGNDAVL